MRDWPVPLWRECLEHRTQIAILQPVQDPAWEDLADPWRGYPQTLWRPGRFMSFRCLHYWCKTVHLANTKKKNSSGFFKLRNTKSKYWIHNNHAMVLSVIVRLSYENFLWKKLKCQWNYNVKSEPEWSRSRSRSRVLRLEPEPGEKMAGSTSLSRWNLNLNEFV